MISFAEAEEDDLIFEQNEEFSMLVNCSPIWFSFDDVDRCKKESTLLLKSGNDVLSGFLEIKTSTTINYFKALFKGGQAGWENKYFVMKGTKLYIYMGKGENYTKPEKVLTLTEEISFSEVRKADIGGK